MPSDKSNNNKQSKRKLSARSPSEKTSEEQEKELYTQKIRKMDDGTSGVETSFNWDTLIKKMDALLDRKLKNLPTKSDLKSLTDDINSLKTANTTLKGEVAALQLSTQTLNETITSQQQKIEILEKKTKRNSVVVSGLNGGSYESINAEVKDIFANVLNVDVKSFYCSKLNKDGTRCCIELNSYCESQLVLKNCNKLKNTGKFIRKDLTAKEDKCRFHIRNLKRACSKKENIDCRIAGASITISGKRFYSTEDGTIHAKDEESAQYLSAILEEVNGSFNVVWNNKLDEADVTTK